MPRTPEGTLAARRRPGFIVAVVAVFLFVSGCMDASGKSPADANPAPTEEDLGRIVEGNVLDDELRPISGATVSHVDGTANASTDDEGAFRLVRLPAEPSILLRAGGPDYEDQLLRVDLQYVPRAEVRFVLPRAASKDPYHVTNTTQGELTCQVAVGSHHGFPGYYKYGCSDAFDDNKDQVIVPIGADAVAGVVELKWTPQSQAADIMGIILYLSSPRDELMVASIHSQPEEHYLRVYTGTTPLELVGGEGRVFHAFVHVDPSALDEHVSANAGAVVQQRFTLYTTAFYGAAPSPTWAAARAGP